MHQRHLRRDGRGLLELTDACNTGVCDATTGSCTEQPKADGTTCDDGDACTTADVCTNGTCAGTAVDCSSMTDQCHTGVCDATTGSCTAQPVADGTSCDDGDACTTSDQCTGGTCAGTAMDCSAMADACNTAACDPTLGSCVATPVAAGTACNDGDACTQSDTCDGSGTCVGSNPVDCTGLSDQCNTGMCDATSGTCAATPVTDGTTCLTGNVCSWSDVCTTGACTSGYIGDCGPTTVVVADTDATSPEGGPGGSAYTDDCPLGQVPIGIQGQVSTGTAYIGPLDHVAVICGIPTVSGTSVTLAAGATVPATGGQGANATNTGPVETHLCPTDDVVVGYSGAHLSGTGAYVTEITLQCAPLTVTGSKAAGFGVAIGTTTAATTLGIDAPVAVPEADCPAGMVARGITGGSGDVLDRFGLTCGTPTLQTTTTAPAGGGTGGTVALHDCPAGQVPVSLTASVANAADFTGELTQVSVQCATVVVTSDGNGGWTVSSSAGARLPATGTWGSYPGISTKTLSCPSGDTIVGLGGTQGSGTGTYQGTFVQQAMVHCAPLAFTGDATAGFTVGYDPASIGITTVGTLAGTPFGPADCPQGTVAKGVSVHAGSVLDGIALRCAPVIPTVQ